MIRKISLRGIFIIVFALALLSIFGIINSNITSHYTIPGENYEIVIYNQKNKDVKRDKFVDEFNFLIKENASLYVGKYPGSISVGVYDPAGYYKDYGLDFSIENLLYFNKHNKEDYDKKYYKNIVPKGKDVLEFENENLILGDEELFYGYFEDIDNMPVYINISNKGNLEPIFKFLDENFNYNSHFEPGWRSGKTIPAVFSSIFKSLFQILVYLFPILAYYIYIYTSKEKYDFKFIVFDIVTYLLIIFLVMNIPTIRRSFQWLPLMIFMTLFFVINEILTIKLGEGETYGE